MNNSILHSPLFNEDLRGPDKYIHPFSGSNIAYEEKMKNLAGAASWDLLAKS